MKGNYFAVLLVVYLAFQWMHSQHDEITAYYPGGRQVTYVADAASQAVRAIGEGPGYGRRIWTISSCTVVDARNWECGGNDLSATVIAEAVDGTIKTWTPDESQRPINAVRWYWNRFLDWANWH
jgi:hypothetical protein